MSSIDSIASPLINPAISRSLVPVRPVSSAENSSTPPEREPPSIEALSRPVKAELQDRADLLQQRQPQAEGDTAHRRHAIGAYRALSNSEERERISTLLGVDEYA